MAWRFLKQLNIESCGIYIPWSGILFNLKKEGNLTHATTCLNLEDIMLSEISQTQKDKYCYDSNYEAARIDKLQRQSRMVTARI